MQVKFFLNSTLVKQASVILDVLIPIILFWSLNYHNSILSWLLLGTVAFVRVLLVLVSQ